MRKLLLSFLAVIGVCGGSLAATYTTNLGLKKPAHGEDVNTWDQTVNNNMDIIDSSCAIIPVNLGTQVTGTLSASHTVSTTVYTNKQNVFTDTNNFQTITASSVSISGPMNLSSLTANQCVQTGSGGLLTTSGASCGGSGGASKLAVNQNGVQITSPTVAINGLSPPFLITAVGGGTTAQWTLDPSSVTLHGQNVILLQSSLQSGATFYVSSATVSGQISSNKVVTSTLTVLQNAVINESLRVSGVSGLTVDNLTAGKCVQAGIGGILTSAASSCGSGGGGGPSGQINDANQYAFPYYSVSGSSNVLSGLTTVVTNSVGDLIVSSSTIANLNVSTATFGINDSSQYHTPLTVIGNGDSSQYILTGWYSPGIGPWFTPTLQASVSDGWFYSNTGFRAGQSYSGDTSSPYAMYTPSIIYMIDNSDSGNLYPFNTQWGSSGVGDTGKFKICTEAFNSGGTCSPTIGQPSDVVFQSEKGLASSGRYLFTGAHYVGNDNVMMTVSTSGVTMSPGGNSTLEVTSTGTLNYGNIESRNTTHSGKFDIYAQDLPINGGFGPQAPSQYLDVHMAEDTGTVSPFSIRVSTATGTISLTDPQAYISLTPPDDQFGLGYPTNQGSIGLSISSYTITTFDYTGWHVPSTLDLQVNKLTASQFVKTDGSKNLASYDLYAGTQIWTGGNTYKSSTTVNGVIAISTTVVLGGSTGTNGQVFTSGGPGASASWTTVAGTGDAVLASTQVWTGGNTYKSSTTVNGVIAISTTVVLSGSTGTNGQVFTSGGPGSAASWTTVSGTGDAILASTQVWTGGNTYQSSSTFVGGVRMSSMTVTPGPTILYSNVSIGTSTTPTATLFVTGTSRFNNSVNGYLEIANGSAINISTGSIILNGSAGTSGQVLTSGGTGIIPSWTTVGDAIKTSTQVWTGGNTFQSSTTFNGVVVISTTVIASGSTGTNGQVLTSGGPGSAATWTTVSASGSGIVSPGTFTWVNTGYGISLSTVVATTSTFTGSMSITSTGTSPSLSITANGTYGTTNGSSGGLFIDCTGGGATSGMCSQFYSNAGAQSALDALIYVRANNTAWNEPLIYLSNAATAEQSTIRMDSGWPTFTMVDTSQPSGASGKKFQWSGHNGTLRLEGRNTSDSAFDSAIIISSMSSNANVAIGQGYNPSSASQLQVISSTNNAYSFYASTAATTATYLAISTNTEINVSGSVGTSGQVLSSQGAGQPVKWIAASSGGAYTLAVTTGTAAGFSTVASSPTDVMNFDQSQFSATLQGSATGFITIRYSTFAATGNYTLTSTTTMVMANCSTACTQTLPTAVGISGRVYTVKMIGTGAVTVATTSGQTIDGGTTAVMNQQYTSLDIISDGSNWWIR